MADIHLTRELLRAVARGDIPPGMLVSLGLEHLTALCPHCREEFVAWRKEAAAGFNYEPAFSVLPKLLARHSEEMGPRQAAAERDFRDLLRLPHKERLARVERAMTRFRGTTLAGLLLDESKRLVPGNPGGAYELAEVAGAILNRTPAAPGAVDLSARAAAYMANALRASGDLQGAGRRFAFARSLVTHRGVTDPLVYAEIDACQAVLYVDQRRFQDAEELLARAITFYSLAGERAGAAHPMVTLGTLYYYRGDYPKAIEVTRNATALIDAIREERLYLSARHNLTLYLCESGQFDAAAEALKADGELYGRFPDPFTQLRLSWLQGKIALGVGNLGTAEERFRAARSGFLEQGIGYDAAMVSLDLALVYLRQERAGELVRLADEMHRIFTAGDVHREAVAALLLFEEAVRRESLTVEFVGSLVTYLRRARLDPALQFKKMPPDAEGG